MGSCAAPSAKGDDKFITTDYLQQCPQNRLKPPMSYRTARSVPARTSFQPGITVACNGRLSLKVFVAHVTEV
uniref:hypothetical protein n=1 Tax=Escherichia coli TaxID=562 RepID=UPI001BDC1861